MLLSLLEPSFVQLTATRGLHHDPEMTVREAHGVMFLCPECYKKNNGPVGTHSVLCWFRGRVPDNETPGPGRWDASGTLENLTLSPSVNLDIPHKHPDGEKCTCCKWHGWVRNGDAT